VVLRGDEADDGRAILGGQRAGLRHCWFISCVWCVRSDL
jgi:hypothetical protein